MMFAWIQGTVAWGCWVIGHECGHGAFLDNAFFQDLTGFLLHSAFLTPYFSWQRSHAVHHSRVNHISEGESHVPAVSGIEPTIFGRFHDFIYEVLGEEGFAFFQVIKNLVLGWPLYLLMGASGGPIRGVSNHFLPFNDELFPGNEWKLKVLVSDLGVGSTLYLLYLWARFAKSWIPVLVLYVLPLLVLNGWLVLYTWLHHTDIDIPHFDKNHWHWVKGAFMTIDREYGPILDFLHHRIGSTHVAHHICSRIPHYHALEATEAIKNTFPQLYLYDRSPIWLALWRVASKCRQVHPVDGNRFEYVPRN
jgi:omega-6 fatty acid desaturase (delta-12 desaturase)